jgi:PBP1b-binding outer membrane lipoprotein LpoB
MKSILTILMFAILLVGCSANSTQEVLHSLSPEALSQPIATSPKVVSQVDPTATVIFQAPEASMTPGPCSEIRGGGGKCDSYSRHRPGVFCQCVLLS